MLPDRTTTAPCHRGFTLVELMVVIVIVSILSALSLSGLSVARARSKADATRSTIRKIDGFIVDMYESYLIRNVPYDTGSTTSKAANLGRLMTYEMPDQWQDVRITSEVATLRSSGSTSFLASGVVNRYAALIDILGKKQSPIKTGAAARNFLGATNSSAECLFVCVVQSGFSPNALEDFRPNEVGDTDEDGAKEFLDASGQPIFFIRWAPGYSDPTGRGGNLSAVQDLPADIQANADPTCGTAQAMVPLIYSCGADGSMATISDATDFYGLERPKNRTTFSPFEFPSVGKPLLSATPNTPEFNAYRDNITNHDAPRR
jgi:prepilin-type N-terminal cleavage/methylation domain-containing protein